ncbi:alpha-galactosidase [Phocaeicola coprophilus]|uniref:Alpha-galactosidase n=1 Tax=Phocaeicola coprophilus DSM 18228 = JCM 13818 TaxID=547042 RepID=S0FB36_9BACT|nr:alpha-galactosidase [Phocaeicola coprophilus]EEF77017.1 alpha-galactosidase [Phocaeicola coprophilus DSM 18228 = JCM 13818]QRO24673.1 alpha-galactosidase [Phocaeicola coprophilus]
MKKILFAGALTLAALQMNAEESKVIRISTDQTDLILKVGENGRLYQTYLGEKLLHEADVNRFSWDIHAGSDGSISQRGWEVYSGSGNEDYFEPAVAITHNDGNTSTYLYYVSSSTSPVEGGTQTTINLRDDKYPVDVTLHYVAYPKENVIKTWSEIKHQEKKPIILSTYASTMLYFCRSSYYLTEFSSDWAKEARMSSQQLQFGKKVIDTKLGSRAAMHTHPFFEVGLDQSVSENQGDVLMGTLGWTGNFRFTFEVDNAGSLRVIPAINPYASNYELKKDEVFTTPEFIFTLSNQGSSQGSRNLHEWARNYSLKDGKGTRLTLLNNWENTGFDFNQEILANLMKEAKHLGVDMFLLDDGWFGNKYPRKDDHAGLGDWEVTHSKLPGGVPALVKAAKEAGVKFGIWIEPEMVNPKSELFEKHPDWAIHDANRKTYYYRNQLVLDLSNPAVQDYVYGVVENLMKENPEIAFFKWDCNSPITNIYSPYLKDKQGQLYIDHVRGVYNVMKRVKENYPNVPMMLCSGGGARCDYEALKYFTEFWCSDNTDPVERVYIQWGFSQFFPAKAMCAHVTSWNKNTSVKFRTDVASMCKLGFDIGLKDMTADELAYCQDAVANWKRLQPAIMDGDQYRLVSPYETNHMAVNYVSKDQKKAVLFAYDVYPRFQEKLINVKLQGLDPNKTYKVEEINLMPGVDSALKSNGQTYTGDYLMKVGIEVFGFAATQSHVLELTAM